MSFTLQRPGLHGVGPTSHDDDDNDPPPSSAESTLTKTTKKDEYDLELEPEKRQAYPSPPRTGSNANQNIPLPGYEEEKHSEATNQQVAFTGGVLDSPILYYNLQNHPPLSPPPTLPTLTAALPSTFNDGTTLEQGTRYDLAHSLLTKPSVEMDSSAETHLFYPLSPFIAGAKIAEDLQHSRLPERRDLGVEDVSRTMIPVKLSSGFGLGPLDMDALLLGDGMPSSSMFEEDRRPWTPHSLYSSLNKDNFNKVNTDIQPDCIHRPYPSPQISPEQRVMSDSSHYPIPNMQSLEPDFEIAGFGIYDGNYNDPDNSYFDALGSQSPSVRALGLPELEDEGNEMDLGLEFSNLTSFPSIASEEEDLVFSPPPSSSSLPSSTDHLALENTHLSSPPTLSSSLATSFASDESDHCAGSGSPNFDNSDRSDPSSTTPGSSGLLLLDANTDIDLARQSYHQHLGPLTISPSSSPPSSLSSSLSDSPISLLESLDSRLFHLPSLLGTGEYPTLDTHPELLEDLYKLLELRKKTTARTRTSNLHSWETEKKDAHSRQLPPCSQQDEEEDVNPSGSGGSQMRFCSPSTLHSQEQHSSSANTMDVETMCKSVDQYSTLTSSAVEYRKPTSKQMEVQDQWKEDTDAEMRGAAASVEIMKAKNLTKQVQNKTSEARAMRKREKERCKEIGALVQLTLFGERKSRPVEAEATADLVEVNGEFVKALATIKTATAPLDSLSEEATKNEKRKMEIKVEGLSRKSKKKKVSVTSMAQLVARMILRRRDPSYSSPASAPFISRPGSGLRPYPHTPMTSPPRGGPRRYGKSPLWQCMTLESSRDGDNASGVAGDGSGNGNGDKSCNVEADEDEDEDDDDLGLGVGLRLKGLPVW